MKIYTKSGDKGETGLIGGNRVGKDDPRIIAYGAVDELNSCLGVALSHLRSKPEIFSDLLDIFVTIQNDLFVIGSDLADPAYPGTSSKTPRMNESMASALEPIIDRLESELAPITFFILPGGSIESSVIHQARSVARRAETAAVALSKSQRINPAIIVYLNRVSDLLFVSARAVNKRSGVSDIAWRSK